MNAAERLNAIVRKFDTNIKAFSEVCGYERPQAFYDILKGRTKHISPNMCDKILSAFPSLNRVWILTGVGDMIAKSGQEEELPVKRVPLVRQSAMAGPIFSYYEDGEDLRNCERIVSPSAQAEIAVPINGDSMEPTFPNGAIAFIARINEAAFIPWGHPLVLETENGVFIKNVLPDTQDPDFIWAESINPKYPPMHIPKEAVFRMYRVINISKPFVTM